MNIVVSDTYEELSSKAADAIVKDMKQSNHPLLCVASGDSPTGLYKELVRRGTSGSLDFSSWYFVGLDEWIGMNANNEGSCQYYCQNTLFQPLKISQDHICYFNGKAENTDEECKRIESYIQQHKGIDVAVVGLGMNGHVGLNEPGTSANLRAHVNKIDEVTQQVGQKYFSTPRQLTAGITLGIADLMDAKHLILIVSGKRKAEIVQKVLQGEMTEEIPASMLRHHKNFTVFLDKDAAEKL